MHDASTQKHSYGLPSVQRGFSLVELLVTIAIIGIITAIVVIKYGSFNSSVLLKSQAYEIALDIREAQVYSISERGQGGTFRNAYGLYFDRTNLNAIANQNQYTLFIDFDKDGQFDNGEEIGDPITLDPRFRIARICANSVCVVPQI